MLCGGTLDARAAAPAGTDLNRTLQLPRPPTPVLSAAAQQQQQAASSAEVQTLELESSAATQPTAPLAHTLALPGKERLTPTTDPIPPEVAPAKGPPAGLRSTVLGLGLPAPDAVAGSPLTSTLPLEAPTADAPGGYAPKPHTKTILGMAPKFGGKGEEATATPLPHIKTILGVARPGIAPLNPGHAKTPAAPETFPSPPPPPPVGPNFPSGGAGPGAKTLAFQAKQSSRVAGAAIALAILLLAGGLAAYFLLARSGAVEAHVTVDAEGRERLFIRCARCEDGTRALLAGTEASFKGEQTSFPLPGTMRVGDNAFTLTLREPGSSSPREVPLSVRVDYRVRADLASLDEPVPRIRVSVEAIRGSTIRVDGKAVALDPAGRANVDYDVSRELTGLEASVRRLERRIPYEVTPPEASTRSGHVMVQIGIAPLVLDAPGESIMVQGPTFVLAGRTAKGGTVTVERRPLQVDTEGRFAQVMNVSSVGETTITVRATVKDHAPRLFPIRVRRVESLAREAVRARAQAMTSYAGIADDPRGKRGTKVALDGTVLERSKLEHSTVFLFEATSGCRAQPCLARVAYGAPSELAAGDRVSVYGRVLGGVEGPRRGSHIPEIQADFVLETKR